MTNLILKFQIQARIPQHFEMNCRRDSPNLDSSAPEYISEINFFKNLGLAIRVYASNHGDEFPATLEQLMQTDLLTDEMKKKLEEGRYEYHVFKDAEKKPDLPAVWWAAPDENGVRVVVLNDGSVHRIREPAGVQTPGLLAIGGAK